jgi:hypothetical protein
MRLHVTHYLEKSLSLANFDLLGRRKKQMANPDISTCFATGSCVSTLHTSVSIRWSQGGGCEWQQQQQQQQQQAAAAATAVAAAAR